MHHHGSDTPTSSRAVLHQTDANLCTILHMTVYGQSIGPFALAAKDMISKEIGRRFDRKYIFGKVIFPSAFKH